MLSKLRIIQYRSRFNIYSTNFSSEKYKTPGYVPVASFQCPASCPDSVPAQPVAVWSKQAAMREGEEFYFEGLGKNIIVLKKWRRCFCNLTEILLKTICLEESFLLSFSLLSFLSSFLTFFHRMSSSDFPYLFRYYFANWYLSFVPFYKYTFFFFSCWQHRNLDWPAGYWHDRKSGCCFRSSFRFYFGSERSKIWILVWRKDVQSSPAKYSVNY